MSLYASKINDKFNLLSLSVSVKIFPKHNLFSCFGYFDPLFFIGINLYSFLFLSKKGLP